MCYYIYIFFLWNILAQSGATSIADAPSFRPGRIVNGEEVRDGNRFQPTHCLLNDPRLVQLSPHLEMQGTSRGKYLCRWEWPEDTYIIFVEEY